MARSGTRTERLQVELGAGVSESVACDDNSLVGFFTPSEIDAGTITLQASDDNAAWFDIQMDALTNVASAYIPVEPYLTIGARYIRLKQSGNAAAVRTFQGRFRFV